MPSAKYNAGRARALAKRRIWGTERPGSYPTRPLGLLPSKPQLKRLLRDAGPGEAFAIPAKGGCS